MVSWAQLVRGVVRDTSGEAIPFAAVQNLQTGQGTYTDLNGTFSIAAALTDTLLIRSLGYAAQKVLAQRAAQIYLRPSPIEIAPVLIRPKDNPAYPLIAAAQRARARWNPLDKPHAYQSYNKLLISLPDTLSAKAQDTLPAYLFLWETETEKVYIDRGRSQEKLLRQKTIGDLPIQSIFSPTTFQPLGLYDTWITLSEKRLAGPIGGVAFEYYDYELLDTLWKGQDTLYHIRFFPRPGKEAWALEGHLYLAAPDYALASLEGSAKILAVESSTLSFQQVRLQQIYEKLGDTLWFPVQLHSEVIIGVNTRGRFVPLVVRTRSYLKGIQVPPQSRIPGGVQLLIPPKVAPLEETTRLEPLSPAERSSYQVLDSLIKQTNLKRWRFLWNTPALLEGRLDLGAIHVLVSPLLLYHAGEGWRPQVGLETGEKFSSFIRLQGWGGYGTGQQAGLAGTPWRWGSALLIGRRALLRIEVYDDVREQTSLRLIDEQPRRLPLTQPAYEFFSRGQGLGWDKLVREQGLWLKGRLPLGGWGWLEGLVGEVRRQSPTLESTLVRWQALTGLEIAPRQKLIQRGSLFLREAAPSLRLRLVGGWLLPPGQWEAHSWLWNADIFYHKLMGCWLRLILRLSAGQLGPAIPSLWLHQLRTLPLGYLGQPYTLVTYPLSGWGHEYAYIFCTAEIPNRRFPVAGQYTPILSLAGQVGYLDGNWYPEGGILLRNWMPPSLTRYLTSLALLQLGIYKQIGPPSETGWSFRVGFALY